MRSSKHSSNRRSIPGILLAGGLVIAATGATMGGGVTALFTDTVPVAANAFTTGTVDLTTSPTSAVVTFSNMAPGDSDTDLITVTNSGSLALRYAVTATATDTDSKALKDQLVLTIREDDVDGGCDDFDGDSLYTGDLDSSAGVLIGDVTAGAQAGDRALAASTSEDLCIRVELPTNTGNAFQDATTTATFTFNAEQTTNN
jgi:hypothetical protein